MAYCWPKAESVLYDEPKRLVRSGLAQMKEEPAGNGRTRAVYTISDDGRAALREWLAAEPAPPRFELESLLRLLYADKGRKRDVLAAVAATRGWARVELARGLEQLKEYQDTGGPFPERLHITVLFADLVARLLEAVDGWATDTEAEIAMWPRTANLGLTSGAERQLRSLIEGAHAVLDRAD